MELVNAYEQYAILDAKIKALTNEKDEIKVQILEELVKSETLSVNTSVGKFTVSKLKSWTYTDAVEEKSEELKALKAKEESTGDAEFEEKPSLRFTPIKF
jgi:hypothetical protein